MGNKIKIPKTVKVGPHYYKIKIDEEAEQILKGTGNVGECHTAQTTIYINPNQSKSSIVETLLHELLHAIWDQSPLRGESITEEQAILILAPNIMCLLQDNPKLGEILNNLA